MMQGKHERKKFRIIEVYSVLMFIAALFMCVGYATISGDKLSIEGKVNAVAQEGVFITDVSYVSNNGADTTNSKINDYSGTVLNSQVMLGDNSGSSITYEITIYNSSDDHYYFEGTRYLLGDDTYDNEDISFVLEGLEKDDILKGKKSVTFKMTFFYANNTVSSDNKLISILNFDFEMIPRLNDLIRLHNTLITDEPTLTDSSNNTSDASGLYSSTATNSGDPTYYFRGNVTNNYVHFADLTWKIIRINEDGTVRLILNNDVGGRGHAFNSVNNTYDKMYYSSGSDAKAVVDDWYQTNIVDAGYDSYVVTMPFCEQAKVKGLAGWSGENATMEVYTEYKPNFRYSIDGNGKGILNSKVGLITYDEVVYAGGYYGKDNKSYYLCRSGGLWTMSPSGFSDVANGWLVRSGGSLSANHVRYGYGWCPVINLEIGTQATGTGTETDPYEVIIN